MLADVVGPLDHPVEFHVFDGIDAEAVAVSGINQVFEGFGDPVGDVGAIRFEVVGALELAVKILGPGVPVVDRAVIVKMDEFIEWIGMPASPPPAEGVVAVRPVSIVVVAVVAGQAVEIGGVVDDDVEDDVDAAGVAGVDQVL